MFTPGDVHEVHIYCGYTIFADGILHSLLHLIRWYDQGNLRSLLFYHQTGVTGLVAVLSLLGTCIPMMFCINKLKFEVRKYLHYLFIPFALGLALHVPLSALPNGGFAAISFGSCLVLYLLDTSYCMFFMTEKIETTKFDVLPTAFRMVRKWTVPNAN